MSGKRKGVCRQQAKQDRRAYAFLILVFVLAFPLIGMGQCPVGTAQCGVTYAQTLAQFSPANTRTVGVNIHQTNKMLAYLLVS
jgi:hypothetical protein